MKLKKDLVLRRIDDDFIIVDPSADVVNLSTVYTLNETAAYLWKSLENKDFELQTVVDLLLTRFEVAKDLAERDAQMFIDKFEKQGVIIE